MTLTIIKHLFILHVVLKFMLKKVYLNVQTGLKVIVSHLPLSWNAEWWRLLRPCQVHWSRRTFHVCRLQGQSSLWLLGLWEGQSSQAALVASSALWSMAFQFGVIIPGRAGRLVTARGHIKVYKPKKSDYKCKQLASAAVLSDYFQKVKNCLRNTKWKQLSALQLIILIHVFHVIAAHKCHVAIIVEWIIVLWMWSWRDTLACKLSSTMLV